jgi:hypothetical protein
VKQLDSLMYIDLHEMRVSKECFSMVGTHLYILLLHHENQVQCIRFHQSIQYSYKVVKYCIKSSSPERVGIYFSSLQFHPWIDLLPQEKSPTAGLELPTLRSICHFQICYTFCVISGTMLFCRSSEHGMKSY